MAEIPKRWVGQEVTVTYGAGDNRNVGTLQEVAEDGILLVSEWSDSDKSEKTTYYPTSAVSRILLGRIPSSAT